MAELNRKRGGLRDDGTMDTVIACEHCGEQMRYTYQPGPDLESEYPAVEQKNREDDYNAWVQGCIEDFDETHAEESPECYEDEDGQPDPWRCNGGC